MKKTVKIILIGVLVTTCVMFVGLTMIGSNAIANSPVSPEDLAEVSECQLRTLITEKGVITYDALILSQLKCEEIDKINLKSAQIIAQKEVLNKRLQEENEKRLTNSTKEKM